MYQYAFSRAPAVRLQYIHSFDWVFVSPFSIRGFHSVRSVNNHVCEEL